MQDIKVHRAISDSLKNHKIMKCIVLSVVLKHLIYTIKSLDNFNKSVNIVPKHLFNSVTTFNSDSVLQSCTIIYSWSIW